MALLLLVMSFVLLLQGCVCGPINKGCLRWSLNGHDEICCQECNEGHRLVKDCGPKAIDLCTPCEPGTFTTSRNEKSCHLCTSCAGALVTIKNCTATSDTKCGCKNGLTCGDDRCSFCVNENPKNPKNPENPKTEDKRETAGTLVTDKNCTATSDTECGCENGLTCGDDRCSFCVNKNPKNPKNPENPENPENPKTEDKRETADIAETACLLALLLIAGIVLIVIVTVFIAIAKTKKKGKPQKPIIKPPTDDPQTLIAIECSFHEAEQEQGSSSESLYSKDSSEQLVR